MSSFRVEMGRASRDLLQLMEPRPSLRPLAPLIGLLAVLWLATAGLIAAQLLAGWRLIERGVGPDVDLHFRPHQLS